MQAHGNGTRLVTDRVRVSVVIPVKNDSAELARCLTALASQSRVADELIVVDNASTDDSARTAKAAGATVISCLSPGIPAASSRGYDAATGDLILRLDADCIPPSTWIDDVVSSFAARPDVAAFSGYARFIDGPRFLRTPLAIVYLLAYVVTTAPALGHRPLFGSNLAMRREAWNAVSSVTHRDDPELHDDMDLSFHLGERHRIRYFKSAAMGMSMRPFYSASSFRRRTRRGLRTVATHWPHDFPPRRWSRKIAYALDARRSMTASSMNRG